MAKELYINGSFIELADDTKIGLTFQANTLSDPQSKQGTFSNEFFAPRSPKNQATLENSSNINSVTDIPYRKNGVRYVEDGAEILTDGFAIIRSYSAGYNIAVYSGNVSPFDLMGQNTLRDIDLSDLDHNYDIATVTASFPNTDGYIYPNIDRRKVGSSLTPSNMGRSLFMFARTLIERIHSAFDYTVGGDLLLDDYYINMILSTEFRHNEAWQDSVNADTTLLTPNAITSIVSSPTTTVYNIGFPASANGLIIGGIYTVPEGGTLGFSATVPVQFGDSSGVSSFASSASLEFVNLGTATILDADTISPNLDIGAGSTRYHTFNINVAANTLNAGDQIQIRFAQVFTGTGIYKHTFLAGSTESFVFKNAFIPYLGSGVDVTECQHNMKQTEFVKGVLNMFCAVPQTNVSTKTVTFNKLNSIISNIPNHIKWTDKFDEKRGVSIEYHDTSYGQKNYMKYSNDQDVADIIKNYWVYETDGMITINDEALNKEQDLIKLPFSGTYQDKIPYMNNDYTIDSFTPRVICLNRWYVSGGVTYYYPTGNSASFQGSANYSFFKRPAGGSGTTVPCIGDNYNTLEAIMTRYKKVTAYFHLNAVDITELDFLKPIFLDIHTADVQVNGFFYLNKVESYKYGETTKCELIRL